MKRLPVATRLIVTFNTTACLRPMSTAITRKEGFTYNSGSQQQHSGKPAAYELPVQSNTYIS